MAVTVFGLLLQLLSVVCFVPVLVHAFSRSVGTGVMVLMLPFYGVYYGFSQYDHRHKGLVLAGWLGAFVLAVVFRIVGASMVASA